MCGLVGYIGKNMSRAYVLKGLSRIEYRGYDSAGFACINIKDNKIAYRKTPGELKNLIKQFEESPIDGHLGIGHTRWSTHGVSNAENAHPQFDCHKTLSLAHNGIIENYHTIKEQLIKEGHTFHSQTDSETIAHLLEKLFAKYGDIKSAIHDLVHRVQGAYALACICQQFPDTMIVVRKSSPLCIGIGDGEVFVASDIHAFLDVTDKCIFLPDKSYAIITNDSIELFNFDGDELPLNIQQLDAEFKQVEKEGHEHFMLKEIYEQKSAIYSSLHYLRSKHERIWEQLGLSKDQVMKLSSITLIACGTSWHAARIAQFFFEEVAKIPTQVKLSSEFRYMSFFPQDDSVYIFISQSGETADTLEALRLVNSYNLPTVILTNVPSSSAVREAGGFIFTHAGQEIAVASTKAFSTQIAALFWLSHAIAFERNEITKDKMIEAEQELLVAAEVLENCIENYKHLITEKLAVLYAQFGKFIFLGRNISYPFAMEAALKLKEISYIFTQCYPAGELKHGPLALIDAETPVWIFSSLDPLIYQKLVANAHEVKARDGHLTSFAFEGQSELIEMSDTVFVIPKVHPLLGPLAMTGVMQIFVYYIARVLECSIDKPRNLAKSVTVE